MLYAGTTATGFQNCGVGANPYTFGGNSLAHRTGNKQIGGERVNRFIGETFARAAATPSGYSVGGAWVLPVKAGGMSSWQSSFGMAGAGDLLQGGPMIGTATFGLTVPASSLSLTVALAGTTALTFAGSASLALTIGMAGNGAFTFTGSASLAMIVPIGGTGSFSITGLANLKGRLGMEGSWGGAAPLSAEALAQAVWAELNSKGDPYGEVVTNTEKQAKLAVALSA